MVVNRSVNGFISRGTSKRCHCPPGCGCDLYSREGRFDEVLLVSRQAVALAPGSLPRQLCSLAFQAIHVRHVCKTSTKDRRAENFRRCSRGTNTSRPGMLDEEAAP